MVPFRRRLIAYRKYLVYGVDAGARRLGRNRHIPYLGVNLYEQTPISDLFLIIFSEAGFRSAVSPDVTIGRSTLPFWIREETSMSMHGPEYGISLTTDGEPPSASTVIGPSHIAAPNVPRHNPPDPASQNLPVHPQRWLDLNRPVTSRSIIPSFRIPKAGSWQPGEHNRPNPKDFLHSPRKPEFLQACGRLPRRYPADPPSSACLNGCSSRRHLSGP